MHKIRSPPMGEKNRTLILKRILLKMKSNARCGSAGPFSMYMGFCRKLLPQISLYIEKGAVGHIVFICIFNIKHKVLFFYSMGGSTTTIRKRTIFFNFTPLEKNQKKSKNIKNWDGLGGRLGVLRGSCRSIFG